MQTQCVIHDGSIADCFHDHEVYCHNTYAVVVTLPFENLYGVSKIQGY